VRFGLLGTLAVWTDRGRLVEVPEAKVRALLADLLIHFGRPVPADRLIDDLWGDDLPVHPAAALQLKVSRLRQALENAEPGGGALVIFRSSGYLLRAEGDALDERRFAALIDRGGAAEDIRDHAGLLAEALALWRGPPLADFADAMFAQATIARLEEQRLVALEEQAEVRLALGEHSLLAGELGELVAAHPLRERLRAAHMLALYRAGRQAEAVTSYNELRGRLADDLGLDPGPNLAALYVAILKQDPGLQRVQAHFGDPSAGEAMAGQALASFRALGDQWGIAAALSTRAKLAMIRGDGAAVHRDAQQSLEIFRELGDRWGQLQAIEWLGAAAAAARDHARAGRLHRDGLRVATDLGLWPQAADALSWLGRSALQAGDLAAARELLERAMRLAAEQGYQPGHVFAELGLGQTARQEGDLDGAETHIRNVLRTSQRIGSEPDVARTISLSELGFIAEQRGDPASARSWHVQGLAAAQELGDPQAVAQALTGLAGARALGGQPGLAARLLGAADAARRPPEADHPPGDRAASHGAGDSADNRRITAVTRQALGETAFAAEFRHGRRLGARLASSLLPGRVGGVGCGLGGQPPLRAGHGQRR
jgi:DNA-binding SARP family transcriptional activator